MFRVAALSCVLLACLLTVFAAASERPRLLEDGNVSLRVGGRGELTRAEVDTFYLLGGPGTLDGRFETPSGTPDWHGWTTHDATADQEINWQVSDYQAQSGAYSMWCGTVFPGGDHGYGNNWWQPLLFTHVIANNEIEHVVRWRARLRVDVEVLYDWVRLQVNRGGEWETLLEWDDEQVVDIDETFSLSAGDYVGTGSDEIQLRVLLESDYMWSDEDGLWESDGACQYDDVEISVDGMVVDFEDFEDQVSDRWVPQATPAVGDFAHIWTSLQDEDPCFSNFTPQVGFIDDGIVVPGTGGTWCTTWCYGPGGYIVNNSGGLAGTDFHLDNSVVSPVLEWPATADAGYLQFEAYKHEPIGYNSAGIFHFWRVRSINTGNPADLENATWQTRMYVYYGDPAYMLQREEIASLLVPGVAHLQVALRAQEIGYYWDDLWDGDDGTPAPYFDNVQVVAYGVSGPNLTASPLNLFNDGFPASGEIDLQNLASNSVRLDMADDIRHFSDPVIDPGDSIVFDARTIRSGAVLIDAPILYLRMKANPVFRDARSLPSDFSLQEGSPGTHDLVTGWVRADSVRHDGHVIQSRWSVDLPDTGFFYPGDVIHYYLEVQDVAAGQVGTAILPADTTGYASFAPPETYDALFAVRALPTVHSTHEGRQPELLLWDDRGDPDALAQWRSMLAHLYVIEGDTYDLFVTNSPSSGAGNGLGGRATPQLIEHYDAIIYTAGDRTAFLLGSDGSGNKSDDIGLLSEWLDGFDKDLLLTGDNVASVTDRAFTPAAQQFMDEHVGVTSIDSDIRPLIGNQTTPLAATIPGNGVVYTIDRWIAYGGCPTLNRFDAVENDPGTIRVAEFTDPAGNSGVFPYAALSVKRNASNHSDVVLLPYDLNYVYAASGWVPPNGYENYTAREVLLNDIIAFFDLWVIPPPGVAPDAVLQVSQYPNPFNPSTTFALDLPRSTDVCLKIYDLRGALVRTLVDERLTDGHHEIRWDGDDDRGATLSSGVYFAETRAGDEVRVHKLALVK